MRVGIVIWNDDRRDRVAEGGDTLGAFGMAHVPHTDAVGHAILGVHDHDVPEHRVQSEE